MLRQGVYRQLFFGNTVLSTNPSTESPDFDNNMKSILIIIEHSLYIAYYVAGTISNTLHILILTTSL